MLLQLFQIALLIGPALLESGNQISQQLQPLIVAFADMSDSRSDLHDALSAPVGRLQRHDHRIASTQRGERDQRQPGWAVEDDHVIQRTQRVDRIDERELQIALLPRLRVGQIEAGQKGIAGDDVDVGIDRAADEIAHIGIGGRIEQPFDTGGRAAIAGKGVTEIALRIGIDTQAAESPLFTDRRQEPGGVRLADAALEVQDGDDESLS